jgi:hypothetical protein
LTFILLFFFFFLFSLNVVTLVEVVRRAAWSTTHEHKRHLLNAGADGVSSIIPQLIETSKLLADAPSKLSLCLFFNQAKKSSRLK